MHRYNTGDAIRQHLHEAADVDRGRHDDDAEAVSTRSDSGAQRGEEVVRVLVALMRLVHYHRLPRSEVRVVRGDRFEEAVREEHDAGARCHAVRIAGRVPYFVAQRRLPQL
jgi:hypothetical protein